jgi:predicted DNA binding protein
VKYYNVKWCDRVERRINEYIDMQGAILDASAGRNGWHLRFQFSSRDQLASFRESMDERGYSFRLTELTGPDAPRQTYGGLTPNQRDALVAARREGYFEVPREITIRELAERLDTSHQAVSELLRRGTANLVDATLTADRGEGEGDRRDI